MTNPIDINPNEVYDAVSLAHKLGVSRQMVAKMVRTGKLPNQKLGIKYFWTGKTILKSLNKLQSSKSGA